MFQTGTDLDLVARRLIFAVQSDVLRWCEEPRLEPELVSALYLRIRDILNSSPEDSDGLADELALAIYLTVAAWTARDARVASILPTLRARIAESMHAAASNQNEQGEELQ